MAIYERYIIKNISVAIILCLIILTGLVWLTQVMRLAYLIENNVNILEFFYLTILIIPSLFHSTLPFATLYSVLYVFYNLKFSKELIVLQNAGVSVKMLLRPVVKIGVFLAFVGIINSSLIMPSAYTVLKTRLYELKNSFSASILNEGYFNNIGKKLVLFLNKKSTDNKLEGIVLFDFSDKGKQSVILAKEGSFSRKNRSSSLTLINGSRQVIVDSEVENMKFDKFKIAFAKDNLEKREYDDKDILELYIWELFFPKLYSKYPNKNFDGQISEGHNRLVWPVLNLVMPLIALFIFLQGDYNRKQEYINLSKGFFFALVITLIHLVLIHYICAKIVFLLYLNQIFVLLFLFFKVRRKY